MDALDKAQMHSAIAFFSLVLLAAAMSGATAIRADIGPDAAQSYVGITPQAAADEPDAPSF